MLPMITVSGKRRLNPLWGRATGSSQWWQNPMLSFGEGYARPISGYANNPRRAVTQSVSPRDTGCYKTLGPCKQGDRTVGYVGDGARICCPGRSGPIVRNPPPPPTAYDRCVAECYDAKNPGACIKTYCAWLKGIEPPGTGSSPARDLRRAHRVVASATRRRRANNGSCCESCANGGACEGGCGNNCVCGMEGPLANVGARMSPQGCWVKGKYVVPCPHPQTISAATSTRAPGCWVKDCPDCKPRYAIPCPMRPAVR